MKRTATSQTTHAKYVLVWSIPCHPNLGIFSYSNTSVFLLIRNSSCPCGWAEQSPVCYSALTTSGRKAWSSGPSSYKDVFCFLSNSFLRHYLFLLYQDTDSHLFPAVLEIDAQIRVVFVCLIRKGRQLVCVFSIRFDF